MKKTLIKILILIAVMTLSLSLASVAFAASGALPEEFFSWEVLATYAGATMFTLLVTQLIKGVIDKIPTRIIAYIIALVVLLAANYFNGSLTASTGCLCAVNAAVVAFAAYGAHDTIAEVRKPK